MVVVLRQGIRIGNAKLVGKMVIPTFENRSVATLGVEDIDANQFAQYAFDGFVGGIFLKQLLYRRLWLNI